ncbi:CynX/NimT family MFS transporter [Microbacterium sp. SS28]|uniref:MFS transporter n=1 Tax=Microbacterium sp. SS28 TaxID=2919948 RepID=UPI001FAAF0A8|nr:MFS transporter [Microbacterium sp. SS28]
MTARSGDSSGRSIPWIVVTGVLVAALSLRGPIVAPTPVLGEIEQDLGIGAAAAGLLTTAPVLMFALLTPLAALVIRRAGAELALLLSLSGVLLGTFVRALPGFGWMLAGMVVIGASVTIGNVVIPVIIRRDVPPARVGFVTAAYAATLNVGSLLTSLLTAPIASVIGWQLALLVWSGITVAGIALWGVHVRRSRRAGDEWGDRYSGRSAPAEPGARLDLDPATVTGPLPVVGARSAGAGGSILTRPVTWLLVASFAGQTTIYYALSTWLPTIAADELGTDATTSGALASLYQGVGIFGALLIPVLTRFTPRIVPATVICVSWLVLTTGLLVAPELLWLWVSIGALGHSGGFVVIFTALVAVARSDAEAAGMSALVQGGGYAVGALGAPFLGALHQLTGDWTLGLAVMLGLSVVYCVVLLAALAASRRATA